MQKIIRVFAVVTSLLALFACSSDTTSTSTSSGNVSVSSITIVAGASTVVANGSDSVVLRAQVLNSSGAGVSGESVQFVTTLGSFSSTSTVTTQTVTTDTNGYAQVFLVSGTNIGTATATANASGFIASTTVDFIAGSPATITPNAAPNSLNSSGTSTITFEVVDANNNWVSNELLSLSFSAQGSGTPALSAYSARTDEVGRATVTYTAGIIGGGVTDTISVTTANGTTATQNITVNTGSIVVGGITLLGTGSKITATGSSATADQMVLTATVVATNGDPVVGQNVTFTRDLGEISNASDTNTNAHVVEVLTDTNGQATVTLTTVKVLGTATITAEASGFTASKSVEFIAGAPTAVSVIATPSQTNPSGASVLSATVTDANGLPVANETISFSITTNNSGAPTPLVTAVTDSSGVATTTYTAGTTTGVTDTITATATSAAVSGTVDIGVVGVAVVPGTTVAVLSIGTSSASVATGNDTDIATITANVLDTNNAGVEGIEVSFSASGGQLSSATATSDASGKAVVTFNAGSYDYSNHVVTITATAESLSRQIPIQITGTTLSVSATQTSLTDAGTDRVPVTVTALDSTSQPVFYGTICVGITNPPGDLTFYDSTGVTPLTTACTLTGYSTYTEVANTSVNGKVSFTVAGATAGTPMLNIVGLGTTITQSFIVDTAATEFKITAPVKGSVTPVVVGNSQTITVSYPGAAVGTPVQMATTLGALTVGATTNAVVTALVNASGTASATLTSSIAGIAKVLVQDPSNTLKSDSIDVPFTADVADAAKMIFQASPSVLPVSSGDVSYTSNLVARVLTSTDQPVAGAVVSFTLLNSTGGGENIFPPIATTDASGEARTTFTSGSQASTADGIQIQATVTNPGATAAPSVFKIVITDEAGSVVIGSATSVASIANDTAYELPMSVLVADANGNPVTNAVVNLSAWPSYYHTGVRDFIQFNNITDGAALVTDTFINEDYLNENLFMDTGEDIDGNGALTPPNSAGGTLPSTVTTDANGIATFSLTYLKEDAQWITDRIRASTLVGGTEVVSELSMRLPALKSDVIAELLPSSPYNASCTSAYSVSASSTTVYVSPGGSSNVTFTLSGPEPVGRPITAYVDDYNTSNSSTSGWMNVGATSGYTTASGGDGVFTSAISISSLYASDGESATIYYYVGCELVVVNVIAGDPVSVPTNVTFSVNPSTLAAGEATDLEVLVLDASNSPVANRSVSFSITTNATGGELSHANGVTDSNGRVMISTTNKERIKYILGNTAGTDTITVSVLGTALTATANITMNPATALIDQIVLTPASSDNASIAVNGATRTIRAKVTANLSIYSGSGAISEEIKPAIGVDVVFTTSAGTLTGGGTSYTATTNSNGIAEVVLTSSNNLGNAEIIATSGSIQSSTIVKFKPGNVATLAISALPTTIVPSGETTLSVLAQDGLGYPVENQYVSFTLTTNNSSGKLQTAGAYTDVNGIASVVYAAGSNVVTSVNDTITASVADSSVPTASQIIAVDKAAIVVGTLEVVTGTTSMTADASATNLALIRVIAKDSSAKPIVGQAVTLTTTLGSLYEDDGTSLYGTNTPYSTDSNGEVSFYLRSVATLGTAIITADAGGFRGNSSINFVAGKPAAVTVFGTPGTINPEGTSNVTAKVVDANGLTVKGETVRFEISTNSSGAILAAVTADTDANGNAVIQYTAGTNTGTDTITAVALSNTTSGTGTITVSASGQVVGTVTMAAGSSSITANGTSTTPIRVSVLDTDSVAIAGQTVVLTTTQGSLLESDNSTAYGTNAPYTTDSNGEALFYLKSAANLGTATVASDVSGYVASADVSFVAGLPGSVTVTSAPSTVNPAGSSTITAKVVDANSLPVEGETVRFEVTNNVSGATIGNVTAVTDVNGNASVSYTAGNSAGTDVVTATAQSNNTSGTGNIIVSASAQVVGSVSVSTGTGTITADGTSNTLVRVIVLDESSAAAVGQTVTLTKTLGTLLESDASTAYGTNSPYTTDANGSVVFYLKSVASLGTSTLTASSSGFNATTDVVFEAGSSATVTLTGAPSTVNPSGSSTLSAKVVDANSLPVSGETVRFEITTDTSGASLGALTAVTNINGVATVSYTAGTGTGSDVITATAQSSSVSSTGTIVVSASAQVVGSVEIATGSSAITANTSSNTLVRITVKDDSAAVSASQTVTLASTLGTLLESDGTTAYGTNAPYTTDANGEAVFYLQGVATIGTATLTASSSGFNTSTEVALEAGAPSTVTVISTPATVVPGDTTTLRAKVLDANSLPVSGESIRFEITTDTSGASLAAVTSVTDENGIASLTYTAGTALGVDTITATVLSNGVTNTVNVTVSSASQIVGTVTITAGAASVVVDDIVNIRAEVKDLNGGLMQGQTVSFTTSSGTLSSATATTDINGVANVTLTAPALTGEALVNAEASSVISSTTISFVPAAASSLYMYVSPSTASVGDTINAEVIVEDANGNRLNGEQITVHLYKESVPGSGTFDTVINSASDVTDATGIYTTSFVVSALYGVSIGNDMQFVAESTNGTTKSALITLAASSSSVGAVAIATGASSVVVSDTLTVRATVTDLNGAAMSGVTVNFTSSNGAITASSSTNSSGIAVATLTAPANTGSSLITAETGGVQSSTTVSFISGAISSLTVTSSPNSLDVSGTSTITATVTDGANPVVNETITFAISTNNSGGSLSAVSATTDVNGQATITYTGGSVVGSDTITAKSSTISSVSGTTSIQVGSVATGTGTAAVITTTISSSQIYVAGVNKTENTTIIIKVYDEAGNLVNVEGSPTTASNLVVSFVSKPNGGETLSGVDHTGTLVSSTTSISVATTDGQATVNLKSGTLPGNVELQISATANLDNATTTISEVVIASGPAETITFSYPQSNAIINLNTTADVFGNTTAGFYARKAGINVVDRYGNAVPDGTVVYLGLVDSVISSGTTGSTAGTTTFTDAGATFNVDTVTRNGITRYTETNDRLLITDAIEGDKSRYVNTTTAFTNTTLGVQTAFTDATSPTGLSYIVGASMLGGSVFGVDETSSTATFGFATTTNGLANIRMVYPANANTILTGCTLAASDTRVTPADSGDVYIIASSNDGAATTISPDACFSSIAGYTLTAAPATIIGSDTITLGLTDGGDGIALPFTQVSPSVAYTTVDPASTITVTPTACITGTGGTCTSTITVGGTPVSGDTVTITYTAGDGSATVTLSIP